MRGDPEAIWRHGKLQDRDLWRGDRGARRAATEQPLSSRLRKLAALGIRADPVYADEFADEVRDQLLATDGVLVWVDPIHEDDAKLTMLRDAVSWVLGQRILT
jgi:hypothetical protein